MIWDNQTTEEVHESDHFQKKMTAPDHDKFWYLDFQDATILTNTPPCYRHALRDEALIKCLHSDVLLQPPNA